MSVVTAVHMGRSENNFLEPFLSCHCTLVSKLVPKTHPKPSHLPSKTFNIVFTNQGVGVWRDGSVGVVAAVVGCQETLAALGGRVVFE